MVDRADSSCDGGEDVRRRSKNNSAALVGSALPVAPGLPKRGTNCKKQLGPKSLFFPGNCWENAFCIGYDNSQRQLEATRFNNLGDLCFLILKMTKTI